MKLLKMLGGSTGAALVEDDSGNRLVVKRGTSPDHIRSEAAANLIYRAAGVPVPASRLDETDDDEVDAMLDEGGLRARAGTHACVR